MTREEAKQKVIDNDNCIGTQLSDNLRLIDEIYNDFEKALEELDNYIVTSVSTKDIKLIRLDSVKKLLMYKLRGDKWDLEQN